MVVATLRTVFSNPAYVLTASAVAFAAFAFTVWLPNIRLIAALFFSDSVSASDTVGVMWNLLGSITTNFTFVSASYTIAVSLLFGINVALLTYYIRKVRGGFSDVGSVGVTGFGGLVSGVLGVGCAACGTFVLSSILALVGAGGVLTYLPLKGEEFGFLGVALLVYSAYMIARKITRPIVCEM